MAPLETSIETPTRPRAESSVPTSQPKDFVTLLQIMLRRWYIVGPAVVVSFLIGNFYVAEGSAIYEATGSQILQATSDQRSKPVEIVSTAGGVILGERLRSADYRTRLRDIGLSDDLAVRIGKGSRVLAVEITSEDAEITLATANMVIATAQDELNAATGAATFGVVPIQLPAVTDLVSSGRESKIVVSLAIVPPGLAGSNPFPASFGTAQVLVDASRIAGHELPVVQDNPGVSIQVENTVSYGAAIVVITASAPSAELANAAYAAVVFQLQEQLGSFQTAASVPQRDQTTLANLISPGAPDGAVTSRLRLIARTVLIITGVATGVAILVDRRAHQQPTAAPDTYPDELDGLWPAESATRT